MILSLINDGNTTLNVRNERTRQGRIPRKSNLLAKQRVYNCLFSLLSVKLGDQSRKLYRP